MNKANQSSVRIFNKAENEFFRIPESLYYESEVVYHAQACLIQLLQNNNDILNLLYKFPSLRKLLSFGLVQSNNSYLKENFSQGLLDLMVKFGDIKNSLPPPHHIILPILLEDTLPLALESQEKSDVFFRMLPKLFDSLNITDVKLDSDDIFYHLIEVVKLRRPLEKSQRDFDVILNGVLLLLKGLFGVYPQKAQQFGQEEGLVTELIQSCLFEITQRIDRKQIPGPKCKNYYTRTAAFRLLLELAKHSNDNLQEMINYIAPIHKFGRWRTKRIADWNIVQKMNEKSLTGYVGLRNLGCSKFKKYLFTEMN